VPEVDASLTQNHGWLNCFDGVSLLSIIAGRQKKRFENIDPDEFRKLSDVKRQLDEARQKRR
jgi:hypothetical protein